MLATQTVPHVVSFPQYVPAAEPISQTELSLVLSLRGRLKQIQGEVATAEESLKTRLEAGAAIELGDHSAELKEHSRRNVAWKDVAIRLADRPIGSSLMARCTALEFWPPPNPQRRFPSKSSNSETPRLRPLYPRTWPGRPPQLHVSLAAPMRTGGKKGNNVVHRKSRVSKSEAISVLALNRTNLFKATKHAANIAKLQEALYENTTNDDSLLETGKTLLIVDYLLNTLSNHGNQEIPASVAFALSVIVNNAANAIRSFLEDIGKEKEGNAL